MNDEKNKEEMVRKWRNQGENRDEKKSKVGLEKQRQFENLGAEMKIKWPIFSFGQIQIKLLTKKKNTN